MQESGKHARRFPFVASCIFNLYLQSVRTRFDSKRCDPVNPLIDTRRRHLYSLRPAHHVAERTSAMHANPCYGESR
jgi:hypothetical protein